MLFAFNKDGSRIEATKTGQRGICPCCESEVISKCGVLKINHWAHSTKVECDSWHEPMSKWHDDWQAQFPKSWNEVRMKVDKDSEYALFYDQKYHIADIRNPEGVVIEVQNSHLSYKDIQKRELFYGDMVWILNAENLSSKYVGVTVIKEREYEIQPYSLKKLNELHELINKIKRTNTPFVDFVKEEGIPAGFGNLEILNYKCIRLVSKSENIEDIEDCIVLRTRRNNLPVWFNLIKESVNVSPKLTNIQEAKAGLNRYTEAIKKPLFLDNIGTHPDHLYWVQKNTLVPKIRFIDEYTKPKSDTNKSNGFTNPYKLITPPPLMKLF